MPLANQFIANRDAGTEQNRLASGRVQAERGSHLADAAVRGIHEPRWHNLIAANFGRRPWRGGCVASKRGGEKADG